MPKLRKRNKGRKIKIGAYKRTIQKEFNKLVTSTIGFCQRCGSKVNQLQCSHVKSIGAYPSLRFDIFNVLCLCSKCHKWWWHDEPTESFDWYKLNFPERWTYIQAAMKINRFFTIEDLNEIRKAVSERNITKLHLSQEQLNL